MDMRNGIEGWNGTQYHEFYGKFTFNLIVHELAHQWFGNMVTCASWNDIGSTKVLLIIAQGF